MDKERILGIIRLSMSRHIYGYSVSAEVAHEISMDKQECLEEISAELDKLEKE